MATKVKKGKKENMKGLEQDEDTGLAPNFHIKRVSQIKEKFGKSGLPRADLDNDPRVFALLDEACNSTCHGKAWAKHASRVFALQGRALGPLTGEERDFKGLGGAKTTGRRKCPWGMELQDGTFAQGTISSNELNRDDNYMLLSLHAQGTLGLVKDTDPSSNTCFVKAYDAFVQLFEVKGSGLRAICISNFP